MQRVLSCLKHSVHVGGGTMNFSAPVIVSAKRTPIGSFQGSLSSLTGTKLGGIAVSGVLEESGIDPEIVKELYFGNVLSAGLGQNPARQAAFDAGLPASTITTMINKVCASSLKAVIQGCKDIQLGIHDVVIGCGSESMSNTPYLLKQARTGHRFGHGEVLDVLYYDGLEDAYEPHDLMGVFADLTAEEYGISREDQDAYAIRSYERASLATESGLFEDEIIPVGILNKRTKEIEYVETDEEYTNIKVEKVSELRPAFGEGGTVTAANASKLSDGGSAVLLMSEELALESYGGGIAKVLGYACAETAPKDFTIAPHMAIEKLFELTGLSKEDVSAFEINEAFSVVALANSLLLDLDMEKVNQRGGAVSLGHPLGCSGARILTTLTHTLESGEIGVAGICNGGGGASAMVIEKL